MGEGGPPHRLLADLRALYPLSLHGVGSPSAAPARSTKTISAASNI